MRTLIPQFPMDLLSTKLNPPAFREDRVARMGLLQKLDSSKNHKLTLVSAPAGYGKTTLLSQWVHHCKKPVGWYSLDRTDNDLAQFIRYFLAALQSIDVEVGTLIPDMMQPPQPSPGQSVWIALINEIAASEKEFILILDDYHELENQSIHEALEYLVDHMPDNMHLILAARADPPFNLAQLRAHGSLLELRAADLSFNRTEAESFIHDTMRLQLSRREIEALVAKAEGWVAGLQIAAMLLHNQPDLPQAVQSFTGSHRHIMDYLASEVIERLPEPAQNFMRQTAILDDLEGSLCDAVTGRADSRQILEQLDRDNQFIVPLDDERGWYRYHRLMAEALRRHTKDIDLKQWTESHRRASIWFQERGMIEAAVRHAFEAGDLDRAADLIEEGAEAILKRSQIVTLMEWLDRLPEDRLGDRPRLNLAYAWALLLSGGSVHAVQARLEAAVARGRDASISAEVSVIRALIATLMGDGSQAVSYSRRALQDLPKGRIFLRSIAASNLGMASVLLGEIDAAIKAFNESIVLAKQTDNILFAVASLSNLGGLHILQGHLRLADSVFREALQLATTRQGRRLPVACRALIGLGEIAREWNELDEAQRLLEEAVDLSQLYSETGELMVYLNLARVLQAQGAEDRALEMIHKAQVMAMQTTESTFDDRLVDLALVRVWLQQANLTGAVEWGSKKAFEQKAPGERLPGDDQTMPYDLLEAEWMLFARLQLAQGKVEAALDTLVILLEEAQKQSRSRRLHEILVLMALAHHRKGSADLALDVLQRCLIHTEPEGYVRVYVDEGPAMIELLQQAARRGIMKATCQRLLRAFRKEGHAERQSPDGGEADLVEPLSDRELEVLHYLAQGCTNQEICERLFISLSTVKGHNSSIYGKLLVKNRTEAVVRARQLGILPSE